MESTIVRAEESKWPKLLTPAAVNLTTKGMITCTNTFCYCFVTFSGLVDSQTLISERTPQNTSQYVAAVLKDGNS